MATMSNFPTVGMTYDQNPYPGGITYDQNPYPGDSAHDQNPVVSPTPPPGLNIDRCITVVHAKFIVSDYFNSTDVCKTKMLPTLPCLKTPPYLLHVQVASRATSFDLVPTRSNNFFGQWPMDYSASVNYSYKFEKFDTLVPTPSVPAQQEFDSRATGG